MPELADVCLSLHTGFRKDTRNRHDLEQDPNEEDLVYHACAFTSPGLSVVHKLPTRVIVPAYLVCVLGYPFLLSELGICT